MTSTPGPASTTNLPGRAVDIVHAAVQSLGLPVYAIEVSYSMTSPGIHLALLGAVSENRARTVFAALGVTTAALGEPYGSKPQAQMSAHVPALATTLRITVNDLPPAPQACDPAALIARADAARADAGQASRGQLPTVMDKVSPNDGLTLIAGKYASRGLLGLELADEDASPGELRARRSDDAAILGDQIATARTVAGERAARFEARFDSVCPACRQPLLEGAPASWLDGQAVHDTCAEAAGIEVYDPRDW
jgi:hypothetical protein